MNNIKISSIENFAFYDCDSLTSITIPDSVTSIGDYAFSGCYKLVEVYNLSSLTIRAGSSSNGYVAYYALSVYASVDETSYLTTTDEGFVFYDDGTTVALVGYSGSETDLVLPDSFNGKSYEIYQYAFYENTDLTSVTIPGGVTSIGKYAFYNCTHLTSVIFEDTTTWYRTSSSSYTNGTEIDVSDPETAATYLRSTYSYWYKQ